MVLFIPMKHSSRLSLFMLYFAPDFFVLTAFQSLSCFDACLRLALKGTAPRKIILQRLSAYAIAWLHMASIFSYSLASSGVMGRVSLFCR